jgi:rifampin ADP-ribosylating transferase
MILEGEGKPAEAKQMFLNAWNEAVTDSEKFTAAHYLARKQSTVEEKLKWDMTALEFALKVKKDEMKGTFSSLYLNIGKCYEDLHDMENAKSNYLLAESYSEFLQEDGYGNMIRNGIKSALERVA